MRTKLPETVVRFLTSGALLSLVACGADAVDQSDTFVDTTDSTDTTDSSDTTDTGVDCGPRPDVACQTEGCPDGQECTWNPEACYASVCDCDAATQEWVCMSDDCNAGWSCLAADACEGANPSIDCQDTGCPEGSACVPSDEMGCVPSSCGCGEDGFWVCTEDCGQPHVCAEVTSSCPAEPPVGGDCSAGEEALECEWGEECCCGECYPSMVCSCTNGSWACMATDACMRPSCVGSPCTTDADCQSMGGGMPSVCADGLCVIADEDQRGRCGEATERGMCDTLSSVQCEWVEPAGCVDEMGGPSLGAAGCFPYGRCADDAECPAGYFCEQQIQVSPRCMWEEPLCDACQEVRSLCVPRGI